MLAGTGFMLAMGSLAAEGLITGSGPPDAKQRQALILTGWQPHSIKIGDMYYSIGRLGVLAMLAGIAADMYEISHAASTEDMATVAAMASHAFSQNILDESFMRGPADMIRAIEESDRFGPTYVRQMMASIAVPYSVAMQQIDRQTDPYVRVTRSTMDAIRAKTPGLSEGLLPKRDVWGEPIPNRESILPGLLAIYESRLNNDPVNQALATLSQSSLKYFPAAPQRKIRGVALTDQQYDDYVRLSGRMAHQQLELIVRMPGFAGLSDGVRHDMIAKEITKSRELAATAVMMQSQGTANDIIAQALANKRAHLTGAP
jgi:hypothetical protein